MCQSVLKSRGLDPRNWSSVCDKEERMRIKALEETSISGEELAII